MEPISIVIPALNERKNLERLLPELAAACDGAGIAWEALVVDSSSEDGTREFVEGLGARMPVRWVNEPERGNLALAWRRGVESARHDVIVTMDADMCHSPEFVPKLARAIDGCDMVIAARYGHAGRQMRSKPLLFEAISRGGQWLCRVGLRLPMTDMTHGFRAFRRKVFDDLRGVITTQGNAFMVALTFYAHRKGFRVREIPYTYGERLHGEEHMNVPVETWRFLEFIFKKWGRG